MRLTDQRQSGETKMARALGILTGFVIVCAVGFVAWFAWFVFQAARFFHG